jgi:predicted transcriptional regulator
VTLRSSRPGPAAAQLSAKTARIDANADGRVAVEVFKALGNATRLAILHYLGDRVVPVNRIAADLKLPASTATMHIAILERAGLLHTEMRPARRGLQKVCARTYDELVVDLPRGMHQPRQAVEQSMPIGAFSDFEVEPTCGLVDSHGVIGLLDDPSTFFEPQRMSAQLLWFRSGFVEYRFPNRVPYAARIDSLQMSAEVCSEAPLHDPDWPSDLTVWVNGVEIGTWTCPGDFGGERGRLTPAWWEEKDTQYGVLKRWSVTPSGTSIDGVALSSVTLAELGIASGRPIAVRIGVRRDATFVGGLNLFGRAFGNYPQDLVLRIEFEPGSIDARNDGRGPS